MPIYLTDGTFIKYNLLIMTDSNKTIIAIATGISPSAIGIIRISGRDSIEGVRKVFSGFNAESEAGKMYYGTLKAGEYSDKCMAVFFKAPHSYTGEDSVEIYCHGSYALMSGIVRFLIENEGFVQAEGGDFTARAFANGKVDLTEAEGVLDIINAQSEAEIRGAYSLLSGELKKRIEKIQKMIVSARAKTEAAIDYPEEDLEDFTRGELKDVLSEIKTELDGLVSSFKMGKIERDGVKVALVGKPNAGKSSLMNAVLGYERAIVTSEKGTTRDTLTESYVYKGVKFVLTDTAGLREARSLPEKMGVERAETAANECDVAVVVVDVNDGGNEANEYAERLKKNGRAVIIAENKTDERKGVIDGSIKVSALKNKGIDNLKEEIFKASGFVTPGSAALNNARQFSAANEAKTHIDRANANVDSVPPELISADLYDAYAALGKITGITGSDALAAEIFKNFCVGK